MSIVDETANQTLEVIERLVSSKDPEAIDALLLVGALALNWSAYKLLQSNRGEDAHLMFETVKTVERMMTTSSSDTEEGKLQAIRMLSHLGWSWET